MDKIFGPSRGFGNRQMPLPVRFEVERIKRGLKTDHLTLGGKQTGGHRMKIEFDRFESTKTNPNQAGKTYAIYRVFGKALEGKMDGQEWTTQFFASARDLATQIKSFKKGDVVNVRLEKNGQFWNPVKFEKAEAPVMGVTAQQASTSPVAMPQPVIAPRAKNMELAISILGPKAKNQDITDYITSAAGLADMIQDYVDKSGMFQFDNATSQGIPDVDSAEQTEPGDDIQF